MSRMKHILYGMAMALAAGSTNGYYCDKKIDRSSRGTGLPYFEFEFDGKKYTIQAVNEEAAKEKLKGILKKKGYDSTMVSLEEL